MKISFIFVLYDLRVGLFWDKKKRWLYIFPIPCFGIIIKLKFKPKKCNHEWEEIYKCWRDRYSELQCKKCHQQKFEEI